ncbi:AbiEi antitoxin N-terminal domain-containing protein [Pseudoroseomonas cervicalis]|uniref:type IV toxin-antitoxin system AbiEi family antitoxin domain-containing protein n=1 Tax=Teichococcus cervicalis TaxID=204525 RepID=UPI0022F16CF9|nr:AbiEi antitoxin N-terminal domain-containing protein [Pseudoroseomonas cervicalis]WBV42520.1 AbiEi antitoxin N-terminal domain-containing protein [Pseudoroseomonas cervicalis]
MTQLQQLQDLLADGSVWRSSKLRSLGIRPQAIANALKAGHIRQVSKGFYYRADTGLGPEFASLLAACHRMPQGVACLLSAGHLAGLVQEAPKQPWIALPATAHGSTARGQAGRLLRWTYDGAFEAGIVERRIGGASIKVTGPARTVVDLVRYGRHLGGLEPAADAIRRFVTSGGAFADVVAIAMQLRVPEETLRRLETFRVAMAAR